MNTCPKFSHFLLFPPELGNCSVQLCRAFVWGSRSSVLWERRARVPWSLLGRGGERDAKGRTRDTPAPTALSEVMLTPLGQLSIPLRALPWHSHWPILAFPLSSHMPQLTTTLFPLLTLGTSLTSPSTHSISQKFSYCPLPKEPTLPLPPTAVSITLMWSPQSAIHKMVEQLRFPLPAPAMNVRVTCMGKYPWTTATELTATASVSAVHGRQVQILCNLWQNIQRASEQVWKPSAHTFPNDSFLEEGLYSLDELMKFLSNQ